MGINATDKNRSLFLKGFNLSRSGENEDPTYLGFKFVFDFGSLPVNLEYGWAPSPLLRVPNYTTTDGAANMPQNMFGQPQYGFTSTNVVYYSAYNYLLQRDGNYLRGNALKRANALRQFQILLQDINNNSPWFFQSITGLDDLEKIYINGFQDDPGMDNFNSSRTAGKTLTIDCLESLNLKMTALANLYNQAMFDADNMRWLVPRNLRKFTMWIYVTEIRNFFKTTRLTGSSAAVAALDDLSSLLTSNRNPGGSIANTPPGERLPSGAGAPGNAFNSFTRGVLNQSGLMNEIDSFRNQQDQSGIKPVLIYECHQCEFDFSSSKPFTNIDVGIEPKAATQSFKIHVGKVRMRTQFPNIRTDGNYLVLGDSYDQNRSSVQIYNDSLDLETIVSLGREILTNVTSQAITDLINEGVAQFINPALSGISQSLLGNIYSLNPSQIQQFLSGNLGFSDAQNFLNGAADVGIDNIFAGKLPNPQTTGLGGPPQRVYPAPTGDEYLDVPGKDLGVPQRVYPIPTGDEYPNVPGRDLGVPQRVYPVPTGDEYPDVPGKDLGVPQRVYPIPTGDEYPDVPGKDLGAPQRIYPVPTGDEYLNVPGSDLGVPDRVYPIPGGDEYADVPGKDLGVPDRMYTMPIIDEYKGVPGSDLGVPNRVYPGLNEDVYPNSGSTTLADQNIGRVYATEQKVVAPGGELRSPANVFDTPPAPVYSSLSPTYQRGEIGKVYPSTNGDFIPMAPVDLGNTKGDDKFNISLGTVNGPAPDSGSLDHFGIVNPSDGIIVPNK